MNKLRIWWANLKYKPNKYWLSVIIFGVIIVFFSDTYNLPKRYSYNQQIKDLHNEIDQLTKEKETNLLKLDAIRSDNETLERMAREEYKMTKPDEDLFLITE